MRLLFIGFGTVGQGLAELLIKKEESLSQEYGLNFTVVGIGDMRLGSIYDPGGIDLQAALEQGQSKARALLDAERSHLLRPDGSKVPEHWSIFSVGEHVVVNNYTFKVAYIGETSILLEPVGPVLVGTSRG